MYKTLVDEFFTLIRRQPALRFELRLDLNLPRHFQFVQQSSRELRSFQIQQSPSSLNWKYKERPKNLVASSTKTVLGIDLNLISFFARFFGTHFVSFWPKFQKSKGLGTKIEKLISLLSHKAAILHSLGFYILGNILWDTQGVNRHMLVKIRFGFITLKQVWYFLYPLLYITFNLATSMHLPPGITQNHRTQDGRRNGYKVYATKKKGTSWHLHVLVNSFQVYAQRL